MTPDITQDLPNILFIISDQHTASLMGCAGSDFVRTLNLDRLEDRPVFCQYTGPDTKGSERMVRYRRYKLNCYHHKGIELFDIQNDPSEQNDLAHGDDPENHKIVNNLLVELANGWDPEQRDRLIRADQVLRTLSA